MPSPTQEFHQFAKYYDIIHQNKNYRHEVSVICKLIQKYGKKTAKTLLDIGCGTATHALLFAQQGFSTVALDRSEEMLAIAKKKAHVRNDPIKFINQDARFFSLPNKFDVIVSLFHVMSYQTKEEDIINFFQNIRKHLSRGGIAIIDCWYGPGVIGDRPQPQYKEYITSNFTLHRFKNPNHQIHDNLVTVSHTLFVVNNSSRTFKRLSELHTVRYFFLPEIKFLLQSAGLQLITWGELGYPLQSLAEKSWSCLLIAKKINL